MAFKITTNGIGSLLFGVSKKHQEEHITLMKAIEKIANTEHCIFHHEFETIVGQIARQQALNTDHITQHEKRLDEGTEDFKEIKRSIASLERSFTKSIASLEKSYAVLAERAEHRREEFEDKDKKDKD